MALLNKHFPARSHWSSHKVCVVSCQLVCQCSWQDSSVCVSCRKQLSCQLSYSVPPVQSLSRARTISAQLGPRLESAAKKTSQRTQPIELNGNLPMCHLTSCQCGSSKWSLQAIRNAGSGRSQAITHRFLVSGVDRADVIIRGLRIAECAKHTGARCELPAVHHARPTPDVHGDKTPCQGGALGRGVWAPK